MVVVVAWVVVVVASVVVVVASVVVVVASVVVVDEAVVVVSPAVVVVARSSAEAIRMVQSKVLFTLPAMSTFLAATSTLPSLRVIAE